MPVMVNVISRSARIIHGLFAAFTVIFSFDVFGDDKSAGEKTISFLAHNIPFFLLTLLLLLAIRRPLIGTMTLIPLGILYILWAWGRFPLSIYFLIAGPLFLAGALYGIEAYLRRIS